ncbi:RNA polymerase sigma factor [Roseomonas fluvialis]|uniref:RNA polymerase sigma factor n=2 Tax=Roseomonas fluvialis TaxID=1750527 RepID=A0ABM7Y8Z2_9PROT|nr:RNA polymerase sigma factor [Roseomonas fluvialis]
MPFEQDMIALLPQMRAYARVLLKNKADADDLVQDAVLRMWNARDRFEPGTNLRAWAFTILRNRFYNAFMKRPSSVTIDDVPEDVLAVPAMQERLAAGRDVRAALSALHPVLMEALVLAIGSDMTYEEVAGIVGCRVGTVKSRVFRARRQLQALLDEDFRQPGTTDGCGDSAQLRVLLQV